MREQTTESTENTEKRGREESKERGKTEDGPDPVNQDQSLGRARNDRRARGS